MSKKLKVIDKRLLLFVVIMVLGTIVFWVSASLTDWESTKTVIFRWEHWYFMDWFGELHRIQTGIYSGDDIANYPAFCFLVYYAFFSFISLKDGQVYDDFTIRNMQKTMYPFFLFMMVCIFLLYFLFKQLVKNENQIICGITAASMLFTAPYVFLFERGNMIIIALIGTCLYVLLYDSDKIYCRILAYFALAVAVAVKLYPAVFGILTVLKKRYKEAVFLILIGVAVFFLPFMMFGGWESCLEFFKSIFGSFETYYDYGFGYDFSIYNLERLIISLIIGYQTKVSNIPIIITFIILLFIFMNAGERWQKITVLCLAIILLPKFSYYYTLCFLAIPFILMLNTPSQKIHYIYLVEFIIIFFPWLYFPIDKVNYMNGEEMSHIFSWGHVVTYIGIVLMVVTLLIDGIIQQKRHVRIKEV